MKIFFAILLGLIMCSSCSKFRSDLDDGFMACAENTPYFFEPSNKSFVPPSKSNFIEELCVPLQLEEDLSYFDLDANKVCILEQHLGMIADSLFSGMCGKVTTLSELDSYYYQYVGLRMGQQDYIFVSAFKDVILDSLWIREPFIRDCNNSIRFWQGLFNLNEVQFEQFYAPLSIGVFYEPEFTYPSLCSRCIALRDLETFQMKEEDLCLLKTHMHKLEAKLSSGCFNAGHYVDLSQDWLHQYMGVHKNGQRWIYINSELNYTSPNMPERFYSTFMPDGCDGGRRLWGVFFDLETKEFVDLQFNHN